MIFNHAFTPGFANQNIVQMEELASHGYVVFSISHPYVSALMLYPNGRIIPVDKTWLKAFSFDTKKDEITHASLVRHRKHDLNTDAHLSSNFI